MSLRGTYRDHDPIYRGEPTVHVADGDHGFPVTEDWYRQWRVTPDLETLPWRKACFTNSPKPS